MVAAESVVQIKTNNITLWQAEIFAHRVGYEAKITVKTAYYAFQFERQEGLYLAMSLRR